MPKSNRGGFGGRRSGTVTVIEEPVRRSSIRTAKIVFYVLWPVVGLLSATVLASKWHPILALLAGIGIGLAVAFIVSAVVLIWPVLRVLWWWAAEITLAFGLGIGWVDLADHTTLPYRIGAVVLLIGVPATIPPARRWIIAATWCLITRHRIRVCFSEFIITNRTGSPAADLLGHPHPGRGTGLDLPAARPGPGRPAKPARPDRGRLLGRYRHRRIRLRVQLRARAAGHQTPERLHRTGFHAAAEPDHPRHPAPRPQRPAGPHRTRPARRDHRRSHAPGQASHPHPRGQETIRARPGPGHHRPRHRRLALSQLAPGPDR